MKLTVTERWILASQYQILEKLDPENASHYANAQEVLEHGYELEYSWFVPWHECEFSVGQCKEVHEILDMFQALHYAYENLEDKSGIEEWRVRFGGFDGNNETRYMAYAQHIIKDKNNYRSLQLKERELNSHGPTLGRYHRMLREWEASENKYRLTTEDIRRIGGSD